MIQKIKAKNEKDGRGKKKGGKKRQEQVDETEAQASDE